MKIGMWLANENEGRFLTFKSQVQGALITQQLLIEGESPLISIMPKTSDGLISFIIHFMEQFFLTV